MAKQVWQRRFGAVRLSEGGVEFRVWAPAASRVAVRVRGDEHPLAPVGEGIYAAEVTAEHGDDYLFVLDELHVGTFTPEGTFAAATPFLAGLRELGVTAVELMPVATFPGERGWGYDGVY